MKKYRVIDLRRALRKFRAKLTRQNIVIAAAVILATAAVICATVISHENNNRNIGSPSFVRQMYLTPNKNSRCGEKLPKVKNIVIHYVGNPGSTAEANRNYFENLQYTHERSVSSHFIVGLKGEIIQCIPLSEVAYANYPRNYDTVSIEVCHPDATGKFSKPTYNSVVRLSAWLCKEYHLSEKDLLRHYDVSGKICPKYYVDNPDAWEQLKQDVKHAKRLM